MSFAVTPEQIDGTVGFMPSTFTVDSLSELKALITRPPTLLMNGYYTSGDGGGGEFYWDANSSTTADDALVIQCTSGPPGRYKRIWSGKLNVKWFGAKGDDSTNDYTSIQNAINAAATFTNGNTVYLPAGTYRKNAQLNIVSPGIVLEGAGMRATIIRDTSVSGDGIKITGVDGVWLENMALMSAVNKNTGTAAAHFDNTHMSGMRNFRIETAHYNGIRVTGGSSQYINEFDTGDIGNLLGYGVVVGENGLLVQGLVLNDIQIHYCNEDGIALYSVSGISVNNVSCAGCKNIVTTYPFGAVRTGDTHSNSTIDGLDTTNLNVGMIVVAAGIFGTITSVGASSVTMDPPIGSTATDVEFYFYNRVVAGLWVNLVCDTADEHGLRLWTNGGVVAGHVFTALWSCSNGNSNRSSPNFHGVYIVPNGNDQTVVQGITFDGPLLANNSGAGIQIGEGSPTQSRLISISNPNIAQNSAAGSGLKPGISIYPGVSDITVTGGFSSDGQILVGVQNLQSYGVEISGTSSNVVISGTNVTGNVTGGILNSSTGTNVIISDCPGYALAGTSTITVTNIAALKALTTRPLTVEVAGAYTVGDGGGTFVWLPGNTTTADDAVWVQPTTGPAGRYKRLIENNEISPHWFGNIPDESFDTYAAGQAAIDWIAANMPTGAVLKFGARAYWKSGEWLITSNRVTLRGAGVATQIVEMSAGGNGIVFRNCDRPTLERVYIWSNLTKSGGTSGVWFDNCHDAYLKDFRIEQHHHGLRCTADWQQYLLYVSSGDIGHCDGDGIRIGDIGTLVQGLFIVNLHIASCVGAGISQFNLSGFQSVNIDIINCGLSFTYYPYGAIKIGDTHSNTIIDGIASTADLNEYGVIVTTDLSYRGAVTSIINANSIEVWPPLPNTANDVEFYFYNQVVAGEHVGLVCDTAVGTGMVMFTNGGLIADQKFYYARCGACGPTVDTARGVHIVSNGNALSEIRDIQFSQLWAEQNGGEGVRIEVLDGSVHHVGFFQSSVGDNSLAVNNTKDGMYVGYGMSHLQIIGGHFSNSPLIAHPNQQRYGIYIESGPTNYLSIIGVDVTGNVTGGLFDGSTGTSKTVIGNPGVTAQSMSASLTFKDSTTADQSITVDGTANTGSGASIKLAGDGVTTPNKWIRAHLGAYEVTNSAFSAVISRIDDSGNQYTLGKLKIGGLVPVSDRNVSISRAITGATNYFGAVQDGPVQTDVTGTAESFRSSMILSASATVDTFSHYTVNQGTIGGGATVQRTIGFYVPTGMSAGVVSNTAFRGDLAAASNIWNVRMIGTAQNFFEGKVGIGNGMGSPVNQLDLNGSFGRGAPITKTADFTLAATENWIINNKSGSACTVTLPSASSWTGREFTIQNYQAQTVISANSNIVPLGGGAAATDILPSGAGKWATLVSNGTNWVIMQAGG